MDRHSGYFVFFFLFFLTAWPVPEQALAQESGCSGHMTLGYRDFNVDGNATRAAEYRLLDAGPELGLAVRNDCLSDFNLRLDAQVHDDRDYQGEFDWGYHHLLRLNLQAEGLVHNLEHIPYRSGLPESRPTAEFNNVPRADYLDHDPGQKYDLDVDIYQAHLRGKLPAWPAHVNLNYWRLERQGKQQLRFADENCAGACHLQSTSRAVDRVTEEVKGSLDAHIGWFDIAIEQLFRQFREKGAPPRDSFAFHGRDGKPETRPAGDYLHDTTPDSRLMQTTVQANTALDGGLVGAASFSIGERTNRSDLSSIEAETDFYKASGDVTYTPAEALTVNFRYRLIDLDSNKSSTLVSGALHPDRQPVAVRATPDIQRGFYAAALSYRPIRALTLKASASREEIERSHTGPPVAHNTNLLLDVPQPADIDPFWELPEKEVIDRFRLGFFSRALSRSAFKLNGWAEYRTNDDPAYGTSFEEGGEAFLSLSYQPGKNWGLTTNLRAIDEINEVYRQTQFAAGNPVEIDLDRQREQQNVSAGFWLAPADKVTLGANYGYLRTRIIQDLLFGSPANPAAPGGPIDYAIRAENTEYLQRVHTLSANLSWQMLERLGLLLEGYHIRSRADYSPDFFRGTMFYTLGAGVASSADLREISRIDIRQNGLKARLSWQVMKQWEAGLEYTFDDYDDQTSDVFDGNVQTCMSSLTWIW